MLLDNAKLCCDQKVEPCQTFSIEFFVLATVTDTRTAIFLNLVKKTHLFVHVWNHYVQKATQHDIIKNLTANGDPSDSRIDSYNQILREWTVSTLGVHKGEAMQEYLCNIPSVCIYACAYISAHLQSAFVLQYHDCSDLRCLKCQHSHWLSEWSGYQQITSSEEVAKMDRIYESLSFHQQFQSNPLCFSCTNRSLTTQLDLGGFQYF